MGVVRRRVGPDGRAEMDVLAAFIVEEWVVSEDATASAKALYSAYTGWCSENGEKAESHRTFGGRLKERGFENGKITSGSEGPPEGGGSGERSTNHPPQKDLQNTDKGQEGRGSGGQGGPEPDINARKNTLRGVISNKGPLHPLHPPEGQKTNRQDWPERWRAA